MSNFDVNNNEIICGDADDTSHDNDTSIQHLLSSISSDNMVEYYTSLYKSGWLQHINKCYNPNTPNKLKTYSTFKFTFDMENYVKSTNRQLRRNFSKLIISAHHLDIEIGRYTRPITPRSERICKSCTLNVIGDEKHFLLSCPKFDKERNTMFKNLSEFLITSNKQDFQTFTNLMNYNSGDVEVSKIVLHYVDTCFTPRP